MNNFLKTREGLEYLLLKYPTLSIEQAVGEFSTKVYEEIKTF
jgi:hypothetical protein